jgi:hypothetical protein
MQNNARGNHTNQCWQTIQDLEEQAEALFRLRDIFSQALSQAGARWREECGWGHCCQGKDGAPDSSGGQSSEGMPGALRKGCCHCEAMCTIEGHLETATLHLTDMYIELCNLGDLKSPGERDKARETVRAHFSNWKEYVLSGREGEGS